MVSGFWRIGEPWWCWGRHWPLASRKVYVGGGCPGVPLLLLLPLSDSLKISQLILSSCITSCSAQAAINYLKTPSFIW